MSEKNFKIGCYATGDYCYTCSECGSAVTGDKRATSCLPCAAKKLQARIAELEEENKHLKSKRYISITQAREKALFSIEKSQQRTDWKNNRESVDQLQARIVRLGKEIFTYNEELSDAWSKNVQDKARIAELEKKNNQLLPFLEGIDKVNNEGVLWRRKFELLKVTIQIACDGIDNCNDPEILKEYMAGCLMQALHLSQPGKKVGENEEA